MHTRTLRIAIGLPSPSSPIKPTEEDVTLRAWLAIFNQLADSDVVIEDDDLRRVDPPCTTTRTVALFELDVIVPDGWTPPED